MYKIIALFFIFILLNCKKNNEGNQNLLLGLIVLNQNSGFNWNLPPGFPVPNVPADNPMTVEKVKLGRFLFYDKKLSDNQTQSCSSCHLQNIAFSDGKDLAVGSTGQSHPRHAQHLSNVAYHPVLTWNDPFAITLEIQSKTPLFGSSPIELGLTSENYLERLKSDSIYRELFASAFGSGLGNINEKTIRFALASFQRTMISGNSAFDKTVYQSQNKLSASARRGMNIFNGEVAECFHCHGGFNFTDTVSHAALTSSSSLFHENGIKSLTEYNALTSAQKGLFSITNNPSDIGRFRAPSLRNVALTYPYMHDGSFHCDSALKPSIGTYSEACARNALGKVIDHYMSGGKTPSNKDTIFIRSFSLTSTEKQDLINFLLSLTDEEFIVDPKFSNPL
jgi:cytochrome c peroxidase